jgi:hypothetical protein
MSNKERLEALKNAYSQKTGGGSGGDQTWRLFYPFWKMPDDATAVVRFLPDLDPDNSLGFLVEKLSHELIINGNRKQVACSTMWGDSCPICELSRKYYDEKNEQMGKKYYKKRSYVGQIIVIESPFEYDQATLVKLVEFGPQVFKQIQAAFQSGDLEEAPYEFKGGYNFRFRKTKTGQGQNSYTTSNFAPKQSDLDDEVIENLNLYNLSDYRGEKLDYATMEALIVSDQTGQAYSATANENSVAHAPVASAPAPAPAPAVPAPTQAASSAEPAAQSKASSVLEQLRRRAQAAKEAQAQ